jgi:hypothetical protein
MIFTFHGTKIMELIKLMLMKFTKQDGQDSVARTATCSGLERKVFELQHGRNFSRPSVAPPIRTQLVTFTVRYILGSCRQKWLRTLQIQL